MQCPPIALCQRPDPAPLRFLPAPRPGQFHPILPHQTLAAPEALRLRACCRAPKKEEEEVVVVAVAVEEVEAEEAAEGGGGGGGGGVP